MKNLIKICILFAITGVAHGGEADAKKLANQIPKLFWYATELWGKLDRASSTNLSCAEFSSDKKTKFSKMEGSKEAAELWKFQMYYEEDEGNQEDESWVFVLKYDGTKWHDVSGTRMTGGMKMQLFEADIFTPSMRPQMKEALGLYNTNKLEETLVKLSKEKEAAE